jgi:hypothetical protein
MAKNEDRNIHILIAVKVASYNVLPKYMQYRGSKAIRTNATAVLFTLWP